MNRQKLFGWLTAAAVAMSMTVGCAQTDPGITTAVKTKLAADDTVRATDINVDTKNGVVTLKGEVQNAAAKTRAIELAKATDGVRDVVDAITVMPAAAPTSGVMDDAQRKAGESARDVSATLGDTGITSAIKTKLLADTAVSGLKIDVDTTDAVVTLKGEVPSAAEKRRAVEIAKDTDGVKSVKDQLKIAKK
jgi:hyperosmotically inducible periplasmic protein